jgi:hypothetical protein
MLCRDSYVIFVNIREQVALVVIVLVAAILGLTILLLARQRIAAKASSSSFLLKSSAMAATLDDRPTEWTWHGRPPCKNQKPNERITPKSDVYQPVQRKQ